LPNCLLCSSIMTRRLLTVVDSTNEQGQLEKKPPHLLVLAVPLVGLTAEVKKLKLKHPHLKVTLVVPKKEKEGDKWNISDELFESADIIATFVALPPPSLAKNLKFIHFYSAGINAIAGDPIYTETNIPLTTSSGVHGPAISEWIILQILANSRKQELFYQWHSEHKWGSLTDPDSPAVRDSVGMRLGVLGYGSIGRQAARICKAMGMDVIAYTASPRETPDSKRDNGYAPVGTGDPDGSLPSAWYSGLDKKSLHNFLSQDIDILIVSVPLTKETTHLLAAEEFNILGEKRNAFVVNISRGKIFHQDDLIAALEKNPEDGGLRGAALDVTDPEPLPADSKLWDTKNAMITPHIGGISTAYAGRTLEILSRNIQNMEEGKPYINLVDRKRGY